ncbi:MAG: protein-disulfide reductase DsbD N-terminal domain-containing protein [Betaproteobacteria bacterium]
MLRALFLAFLLAAAAPAAAQLFGRADELLEPEQAFRISARALDARSVEVQFRIADGYYMYRDRFRFATESGNPLAEVEIPRGKIKEDAFFGKSETFRDLVKVRVPVSAQDAAKGSIVLKVTSQGCSDKGVCYVPLEQAVRVILPKP